MHVLFIVCIEYVIYKYDVGETMMWSFQIYRFSDIERVLFWSNYEYEMQSEILSENLES